MSVRSAATPDVRIHATAVVDDVSQPLFDGQLVRSRLERDADLVETPSVDQALDIRYYSAFIDRFDLRLRRKVR